VYLIGKIEELKALTEEYEKLKHSHTSLIGKHENLEKEYACARNISTCAALLEKENANLKAQFEVHTSKHVKVQKYYEKLKCSHENLQDAHVMLQVSLEVMVTSVKHLQPPIQKCTCSLNSINFICANVRCSQSQQSNVEQVHGESGDDFIAQENDQLMLEVKRLEVKLGVNVQASATNSR
jgi:predicted  nucleic acid-binding Zn-ribbon protein